MVCWLGSIPNQAQFDTTINNKGGEITMLTLSERYDKDVLKDAESVDLSGDKFCKVYDGDRLLMIIGMMSHDKDTSVYIDYDEHYSCVHLGDEFGDEKASQLEILF